MDIIVVRTLKLAAFKVVHQVAQERDGLGYRAALRFVFVLQEAYIVHCLALRCHNQAAVASAVWRWQRPRRLFRRGAAIVFAFSHCVALFWATGRTFGGCGPLRAAGCQPDRAQGATGMRGVEFSAAIHRGLPRLSGPGSGISGGEKVLISTGCWFRPAPRMPLCAAPMGYFVALWYRVRLLIWPRANPLSHITPGATLQQAKKAGPEGHGEQAPTARTSRSRGERIRFTISISR